MDKDVVILTDVEGLPLYPMTKMGAVTDETGRGLPAVLGDYAKGLYCFGEVTVAPGRNGQALDAPALAGIEEMVAAGVQLTGSVVVMQDGRPVRLSVTGYRLRRETGWHGVQIETAATDTTNSNIRMWLMRVVLKVADDGRLTYDTTALRRIDIPMTGNLSIDVREFLTDATVVEHLAALVTGGHGGTLAAALLDSEELRTALAVKAGTEEVEGVRQALNTLMDGDVSDAIESFREVLAFLDGVTDEERLSGLLNDLRVRIDRVAEDGAAEIKAVSEQVAAVKTVADGVSAMTRTFTRVGYVNTLGSVVLISGEMAAADVTDWTSVSLHTELVPVNRRYDIVVSSRPTPAQSQIAWYDAGGGFIGNIVPSETPQRFHEWTVSRADIPENAAYFRLSSYVGQPDTMPWYRHAPTDEARGAALVDAVQAAKRLLFIDMWNAACGKWGRYNPLTGYFELNGLTDITYGQAIEIYNLGAIDRYDCRGFYRREGCTARTNLPRRIESQRSYATMGFHVVNFMSLRYAEVINLDHCSGLDSDGFMIDIRKDFWGYGSLPDCWLYAPRVRKIIGVIDMRLVTAANSVGGVVARELEDVLIANLKVSTYLLVYCPKLSVGSAGFLVANAANTEPITVPVHPDVYAKLTAYGRRVNLLRGADVMKTNPEQYMLGQYAYDDLSLMTKDTKYKVIVCYHIGAADERIYISTALGWDAAGTSVSVSKESDGEEIAVVSLTFNATKIPAGITPALSFHRLPNDGDYAPDTYVKWAVLIPDDGTEGSDITEWVPAASELAEDEQEPAKWANVLALAAARKITFATVEAAALSDGDIMDVDYECE